MRDNQPESWWKFLTHGVTAAGVLTVVMAVVFLVCVAIILSRML